MSTELAADRVPEEASGTDSHKSSSVLLSELYDLVRTKHGRSSVSPSAGEKSAAAASKTAQDVCTSSTDVTMTSNQAAINLTTSSVSHNADTSERAVRSSSRDRRHRSPDSSRQCDKRSSTSRNRQHTGSHSGRKYRRDRSPSGSGSRNDERHSRRTRRHDSLTSSNDRSSDDDARDKRRHHHHHRRRSRRTSSSPSSRSSSTSRRSRSRRRTSKRTKTSKDKDGRKRTGARESDRESSRSDSHQRSVSPSSRRHHPHHHHDSSRHYHNRLQLRHHSPRATNNRHRPSSSPRSHEDRIDKRKLLEVARENAARILAAQSHHTGHHVLTPSSTSSAAVVTSSRPVSTAVMSSYSVRQDVMCASVNQLTEICRQVRDGTGTVHYTPPIRSCTSGSPSSERSGAAGSITSNTTLASAVVLNSARLGARDRQLVKATVTSQFPVSSGEQHREHESTSGPHHSGSSAQTADAHTNEASAGDTNDQVFPTSSTVMARGCLYGATPGEFTGSTGAKTLTAAQLNTGYQAWARKDQLRCTEPVRGGFGELMMKKMGWQPGRGLGKHQHGSLEPISVDVKNDKRGLLADGERKARKTANSLAHTPSGKMIGGKNPVSVLMEYSNKTRCSPVFEVIFEGGPSHLRNFLFKVSVNGRSFQPSKPSQNKKLAKAEAAMLALQGLGLLTSSTGDVTAPGQSNHAQPPHHMPFVSNGFYEHDETNAANLAHDVHHGGFAAPAPVPHRPAHKTLLPTPIGYGSVTSSINHTHMPVNATLFAPPPSH